MYNSQYKCLDEDLTFLSFNQKINKSFNVGELEYSKLWVVEKINDVLKCIPLFNCDSIVSSNPNDIILGENKCLICHNIENTVISCISDDTGGIKYYNIFLYAYVPYSKLDLIDNLTVYCVVYDEYLNTLNNVSVDVLIDNTVIATINTDNEGVCQYNVGDACNIKFKYGDSVSNTINIVGE